MNRITITLSDTDLATLTLFAAHAGRSPAEHAASIVHGAVASADISPVLDAAAVARLESVAAGLSALPPIPEIRPSRSPAARDR